MRIALFVTTLFTVVLLQGCGGQPVMVEANIAEASQQSSDQLSTTNDKNDLANQTAFEIKPVKNEQHTTPETQIIRELYHAGCVIEDFELDRRKQNMHISCAKDIMPDNSRM